MKKDNSNLSRPGKPLPHKQFIALVKEAEVGPFYSLEESKRMFKSYRDKIAGKR